MSNIIVSSGDPAAKHTSYCDCTIQTARYTEKQKPGGKLADMPIWSEDPGTGSGSENPNA